MEKLELTNANRNLDLVQNVRLIRTLVYSFVGLNPIYYNEKGPNIIEPFCRFFVII
jgi:hypothetical protein